MVPNVYVVEEDLVLEAGVDDGSGVLMAFLSVRFFKRYVEGIEGMRVKENVLGVVRVVVCGCKMKIVS